VGACQLMTGYPLEPILCVSQQVAHLAALGEILITETLHAILAGSGFVFNERNLPPKNLLPANSSLWTLVEST
jgi:hypothetical protein